MFTGSNPKKKPYLTLNIPQQPHTNKESEKDSVLTPSNELDSRRVKQAFAKPSTAKKFIDQKGNIGIEYSNRYLLKLQQPITPGAHANVQKEQLVSPGGKSSLALVGKCGTSTVASEIKIYQLISSNNKSAEKAILQPLFSEKNHYENTLHFPLMPGGNLKKQQNYLFKALKDSNKKSMVTLWLYKQVIALLEAINHLHTEEFSSKNKHYKGIVHGDIKLDNILINRSGNLILADFGCAYPKDKRAKQLGSILHTAPEIFANDNFAQKAIKDIEKSDSWSLGIALYCLLMNKFPCLTSEFPEEKKYPTQSIYLNHEHILPKNYFKKSQSLFFNDGIDGYFYRKKWGENFSHSVLAEQAREAIARLNNNDYSLYLDLNQRRVSILTDLSLAMLLPAEERLSASELLKQLKKLTPLTKDYSISAYNTFISGLLAQSSLNQSISIDSLYPLCEQTSLPPQIRALYQKIC